MFNEAGTIYVYLCYGMHNMLNIVTREKDYPSAVLIRGTLEIKGPGRLTKHLNIDRKLNGKKIGEKSGLWFEMPTKEEQEKIKNYKLKRTKRIGVDYAGEIWANKKYRFLLEKNE